MPLKEQFEVLPGLPTDGPLPRWIPESWKRTGREGVVVRFTPEKQPPWTGNFRPGPTALSTAVPHPNGQDTLVVAGGNAYLVNIELGLAELLDTSPISGCWRVDGGPELLLEAQGLAFFRLGADGIVWHTRRISWDGFQNVTVGPFSVTGQAWSPLTQEFHPFIVDLETGRVTGGAPQVPHQEWERLAGD
jgi:hypothetical protein